MTAQVRSLSQRQSDALANLVGHEHLWIATASADPPKPHLVPLSYAWTGSRIIIATASRSSTGGNLHRYGIARIAIGATDDVVMIDVTVEQTFPIQQAPADIADLYASQSDWDPRAGAGMQSDYFILRPTRIQAWRQVEEQVGRTLMSNGEWLKEP